MNGANGFMELQGAIGMLDPYRPRWRPRGRYARTTCILEVGHEHGPWRRVGSVTFGETGFRESCEIEGDPGALAALDSWCAALSAGVNPSDLADAKQVAMYAARVADSLTDLGAVWGLVENPVQLPWDARMIRVVPPAAVRV